MASIMLKKSITYFPGTIKHYAIVTHRNYQDDIQQIQRNGHSLDVTVVLIALIVGQRLTSVALLGRNRHNGYIGLHFL